MRGTGWRWRWRRSPLRRRWDVRDAWLGLLIGLALVLGAPAAGAATGLLMYEAKSQARHVELHERHRVTGVLLESVPDTSLREADGAVDDPTARTRWRGADGRVHTGDVRVPPDRAKGARVPVWLTRDGRPTEPPLTPQTVRDAAVTTGIAATAAAATALLTVRWAARRSLDRARLEAWEREWAVVGPQWRHRHT
ncbi:hypothetical protein [Streptomyces sp. ODS28]|uniref:Rv1733c family protein n=1 Tax=Streptomyces sp. ODS28 TaxID=3136688 RepID=UPI0031E862EE